jgi:Alg9-like mannosyltransferase family
MTIIKEELRDSETCGSRKRQIYSEGESPVLSPYLVFAVLVVPRLLAAQYSIIGDCDEGTIYCVQSTENALVYNYWEPTHYLVHGTGFQTWEYSPVYAIRSWAYIAIHALVIKTLDLLNISKVSTISNRITLIRKGHAVLWSSIGICLCVCFLRDIVGASCPAIQRPFNGNISSCAPLCQCRNVCCIYWYGYPDFLFVSHGMYSIFAFNFCDVRSDIGSCIFLEATFKIENSSDVLNNRSNRHY